MIKGRIMGIDYGSKRVGIAVTDPMQIIVSGLNTVENESLQSFLAEYLKNEPVVKIVFGKPVHKDGEPTILWKDIQKWVSWLEKSYPSINIDFADESFTSYDAKMLMVASNVKKKARKDKKNIDKLSAVLILQKYLGHI